MMVRYQKAFTLVEVLVTITLSFLLTGLGLVMYRDYYNRKVVKVVADGWARELEVLIKETDSGSVLNSDIGNGCDGSLLGTIVDVTSGSSDYRVYLDCSITDSSGVSYSLETNDPGKVVVFGSNTRLVILPLSKGVKEVAVFDICLKQDANVNCYYQVQVDKSGVVSVK